MPIFAGAGLAGLLALALLWAAPPAASAATASAERRALGSVTAVSWGLRTPVGKRLRLRPFVALRVQKRELRLLGARKPRVSVRFVARFVTRPRRGRARTLAVVARRVRGHRIRASGRLLGRRLRLRRVALTRRQTARVKRAARRGRLAIVARVRYRVRYTNARGRTVATPTRSRRMMVPLRLKRQRARGANRRKLAVTMRRLMKRVWRLRAACVTRNGILRQLRSTYATMLSGDRSGAAAMLAGYIREAEVMRSAGLLKGSEATMLRSTLGRVLRRVGSGRSKRIKRGRRWASLPSCRPARAGARSAAVLAAIHAVVKRVRKAIMWEVFLANRGEKATYHGMKQLRKAMWPDDPSEPDVNDQIPDGDTAEPNAESVLDDLKGQVDGFLAWQECCAATDPHFVLSAWNDAVDAFKDNRWRFQLGPPYYTQSYQVSLLPLFSEYTNMYLQLLREGVVNGPRWGLTPETTLSTENTIRAEVDPGNSASAMSYTKRVYDAGLAAEGSSSDPQKHFNLTNDYKREMQLAVLDFKDTWHLRDPMAFPYGDPGFKQDRIIYSDAIGSTTHTFAAPPNPSSPLSAVTVWATRIDYDDQWYYHFNQNWVTAIQADNSPQVGTRTGAATSGAATTYNVAPGSAHGPIVQVGATWDQRQATTYPQKLIGTVRLYFSDRTYQDPGGNFYTHSSYPYYSADCCTSYWSFGEADSAEVLAAAKIMGGYEMIPKKDRYVGDSLVLGFRQADSFDSQWKGSLPGQLAAPNTGRYNPACLAVEQLPTTSGTTGSRANGAAIEMRDCSTAWEQTWNYVDYNNPDDPEDDDAQRDLNVYAGTMCAAPKDGATTPGTPVQVYYCDGTPAQNWTRNADASITNDQSNLCLERAGGAVSNGTPIRLNTCNASDAQKWTWPK